MPVTIPLDVYRLIFEYFSVRRYPRQWELPSSHLIIEDLTPSLPKEARATLNTLSLASKPFNEFARTLSLKDSRIASFSDFTQLCGMAKHCRLFPIETLIISLPCFSNNDIQDMTSPEFLSVMKHSVRLRSLRMDPPALISSHLPHALESLAQCGTWANLRSLELFLQDKPDDRLRPDPNDLAQVLLLMPNLTVLQIYVPKLYEEPYDRHEASELPPPPFRLEYLVICHGYLDLEWLTSTSHNHLKLAHIANDPNFKPLLNMDHPWPKLLYLNLLCPPNCVLKTLRCCPNVAFLALEQGMPTNEHREQDLVKCFDAFQRPLIGLTLALVCKSRGPEGEGSDLTMLATAIRSHPFLSELRAFTIEIEEDGSHQEYENYILPLQHVCEAKRIHFAAVCLSSPLCDDCGTPGYIIPLPHEL